MVITILDSEEFGLRLIEENAYLGGTIRQHPSDFIVEEVWDDGICNINYSLAHRVRDLISTKLLKENEYTHFTFIKKDWETIRALNRLRRPLRVSLNRFGIAGMKDKKAITAQRVSVWNINVQTLMNLKVKDITLKDFRYANERITLGNAIGNRFTIVIRDIPGTKDTIKQVLLRFQRQIATEGIPNFFGSQRLGGNNAAVGKAIKDGDLKQAVGLILEKIQPRLSEQGIEAVPKVFWYEKRMVRHLRKHPNDYAGALRKIPKKIRKIFVHAFQSYLFNEQLKQAIGNSVLPETITILGFKTPKMPELSTTPITRRILLTSPDFQILEIQDGRVKVRFSLSNGEYASTLLTYLETRPFKKPRSAS